MSDVERYLKRATRGVWGRKRQEVREELHVHLLERVAAYRISGLSEADAVEKALREMGEPGEVSAGMARIYTGPWVAGSGVIAAALCGVAITVASLGMAQTLEMARTFPSPNCLETNTENPVCRDAGAWTTFDALRDVLEPQGVKFVEIGDSLSLQFSNGEFATVFKPALTLTFVDDNDKPLPEKYQAKPNYFSVWDFLRELVSGTNLSVRVEGWQDLTVHVSNASFTLSGAQEQAEGFYYSYLTSIAFNPNQLLASSYLKNPTVHRVEESKDTNALTLQVRDAKPDATYGIFVPVLATADPEPESDLTLVVDVAQVRADGILDLHLSADQPLTFLDEFSGEPQLGTAVLVRLTGESRSGIGFSYEVVPPEQISAVNQLASE